MDFLLARSFCVYIASSYSEIEGLLPLNLKTSSVKCHPSSAAIKTYGTSEGKSRFNQYYQGVLNEMICESISV